ncbi:Sugar (and other) transporter, partial [Geosmithia morbida]
VTWSGPDDPINPLNWSRKAKWTATILVSSFTFISPIASTMLSPSLDDLADEFDTEGFETYLIMSIFLLAYAVGPFILAPLSEMYGRVVILQASNMGFLLFNTVCGFARTKSEILLFRFLSGLGGAAPQAIGSGVLSDCWSADERGAATAMYSLAPFLGPAVGPIAGGFLTQYMNWRWIFWVVSIADAVVQILAFCFLTETYRPAILKKKARKLRRSTGNGKLHTEAEAEGTSWRHLFGKSIMRPFIMLTTQPTIQITGLYRAYLYGLMYLVLASFPTVWEDRYGQEPGRASLNYISLGVGFVIGLQISGPAIDKTYKYLKERRNSPGCPEFRIPLMFPTAVIAPGGLLLYGLSAHFRTHWIVPDIGAAIFAMGLILSFQCAQTYIIDSYETYTASAAGASAFIRTMAGFSFPLFADGLYESLGIAGGNGLLAGLAFAICLVASTVLWKYGKWIRKKSPYCAG